MLKIENVKNHRSYKEKEKLLRLLTKEEEIQKKRKQAKLDRENNEIYVKTAKD